MKGAIGEWRRAEGGRFLTRRLPAEETSVCAELRYGCQVFLLVEICFVSRDVNETTFCRPLGGLRDAPGIVICMLLEA